MLLIYILLIDVDLTLHVLQSGYQLVVRSIVIVHFDPDIGFLAYDWIDQTIVEIPASALGQSSPPQTYPGNIHEVSPVAITLSYSLGCSPKYKLCSVNTVLQCVHEYECIDGKSKKLACMGRFSLVASSPSDKILGTCMI